MFDAGLDTPFFPIKIQLLISGHQRWPVVTSGLYPPVSRFSIPPNYLFLFLNLFQRTGHGAYTNIGISSV